MAANGLERGAMDVEQMRRGAQRYPDAMDDARRNALYLAGEEVDHIPAHLAPSEEAAPLFGYTLKQFRDSAAVKLDVSARWGRLFGSGSVSPRINMGLHGFGVAVGSTVASPSDREEYVSGFALRDYAGLGSLRFDPESSVHVRKLARDGEAVAEGLAWSGAMGLKIPGPVSAACSVRAPEEFLRDMGKRPDDAHRLLETVLGWELDLVRWAQERYGKVSVSVADPCTSLGFLGKRNFRVFSRPYLARLLEGSREVTGKVPALHICGKSRGVWADLRDMGVSNFSVDNREDLGQLKGALGDVALISGNVPPVDVMLNGSIDDVVESVRRCLLAASDSPCGYVLGLGCSMAPGTPRENIEAFFYAARKYGRGARKGRLCRGLGEGGR